MNLECGKTQQKGASGLKGLSVPEMKNILTQINWPFDKRGRREDICAEIKRAIIEKKLTISDTGKLSIRHSSRVKSPVRAKSPSQVKPSVKVKSAAAISLLDAIKSQASPNVIEKLLDKGASINERDEENETPLSRAFEASFYGGKDNKHYNNMLAIMDLLLRHGADIESTLQDNTLLSWAIRSKNPDLVIFLLEHGADVNKPIYHMGELPIYQLIKNMSIQKPTTAEFDILQILLDHGAFIPQGVSFLTQAVRYVPPNILQHLIQYGADVNEPDKQDNTPLTIAIKAGNFENAMLLLDHGADPNYNSPLMTAIDEAGKFIRVHNKPLNPKLRMLIQTLLERGANPTIGVEITPLRAAIYDKLPSDIIQSLIYHGADVNEGADSTESLIFDSLFTAETENLIKVLLDNGANPNVYDKGGRTPLLLAVRSNDIKIAKELLSHQADPQLESWSGDLPIDNVKSKEMKSLLTKYIS